MLSSPEGDSNFFSELFGAKKPNGQPMFREVTCYQICARCLKLERAKQILCTHVPSTAHWLSAPKIRELKELYRNSPENAIREFGGVVVSDYLPALRAEEIDNCFNLPRFVTTSPPPLIITAVDPSGGGPSHLSIASGYFNHRGELVVSNVLTLQHERGRQWFFECQCSSIHVTWPVAAYFRVPGKSLHGLEERPAEARAALTAG